MTLTTPITAAPERKRFARTALYAALTLAVTAAMLFFGQSRALAHDVLVDQTPANGEILDTAPDTITLSFNNELLDAGSGTSIITVTDANGAELDLGYPDVIARDAVLRLGELEDGAYRAVWTVVSSDGHRIAGEFFFGVGSDSADAVTELEAKTAAGQAETSEGDNTDPKGGSDDAAGLSPLAITGIAVAGAAVIAVAAIMFWRKSKNSL